MLRTRPGKTAPDPITTSITSNGRLSRRLMVSTRDAAN